MTNLGHLGLHGLMICLTLIFSTGIFATGIISKNNEVLLSAAESGNLERVARQLSYGADINARNRDDVTPLHFAVLSGHQEVAELLIVHGADVQAMEKQGGTPLYFAAIMGYRDIVRMLIAYGARIDTLNIAAFSEHEDISRMLIAHSANFNDKEKARLLKLRASPADRETQRLRESAWSGVNTNATHDAPKKLPGRSDDAAAQEKPLAINLSETDKPETGNPKAANTIRDCPDCPEMIIIPDGSFEMGEAGSSHRVTLKRFALGRTEVTQSQWKAIMGNNPSHFVSCGDHCPVEQVSWNDVQEFIRKLNTKTGMQYRLPSETEWQYACMAGQQHQYCGGNNLDSVAWHEGNSENSTHPAAGKQANAFGLYDMNGNVWEWVADNYHADYNGAPTDGSAWQDDGEERMLLGGSWIASPRVGKNASRNWNHPSKNYYNLGFRLARTIPH